MVQELRPDTIALSRKMDWMDWLARNAEFMSPEAITKCLSEFKDLYNFEDASSRNAFIKAKHNSDSVLTVGNLIQHVSLRRLGGEDVTSRLAILLSIYEPLLINDINLEKTVQPNEPILDTLIQVTALPRHFRALAEQDIDQEVPKVPIYLKYAIRCLTSCIRSS